MFVDITERVLMEQEKARLEAQNSYLQEEIRNEHNFGEIVGNDPRLRETLHMVEQIAAADSTVLILGETGTGKELVARAIHDRSPRKQRALVKVNCGAISAGLVESELFGHVKGAFTGAITTHRDGRFKLADGGTIFLDEVGELPPETQVKLLRVLQEQEYEPLGSSLALGADIVMHSVTKYLGGHSDVVMGALITNDDKLQEQLYFILNSCGANPGPMDCFLVLRGIKTLHLRVQWSFDNARQIANSLLKHPKISRVLYPGFENHPGHLVAKQQMNGFGAMISFDLKDGQFETARNILSKTKLFACAESLGGVESLIGHPASMTHASIPKEDRLANGLTDSLIRLSIGVEDVNDLIEDLDQAI